MTYVLPFTAIRAADLSHVGGKGANLGEMTQAGFPVPPGFCVTTTAFRHFMDGCMEAGALYATLATVTADNLDAVRRVGEQVRTMLVRVPIPDDVAESVLAAWRDQGQEHAYAVRSSATAEDLPDASFAGQQDTYLNVRGADDLLESVRNCWVSLFTDRAILYRIQNGFSHRDVLLSVVVQQMVLPEVSGILFTADPVTQNRQIITIDASYGLGEALVSGLVSADLYKVDKRTLREIEANIADKQMAIHPLPNGGTFEETLQEPERSARVLPLEKVVALAEMGTRIEAHYGKPQDIEWALAPNENNVNEIYIVQSRPITSLYPLPQPIPADDQFRVYLSMSHEQMMTDPMPPITLSAWRLFVPLGKDTRHLAEYNPYMATAGGRLYLDPTPLFRRRILRRLLLPFAENVDTLMVQALLEVLARPEFQTEAATARVSIWGIARWIVPLLQNVLANLFWRQPEGRVDELNQQIDRFVEQVRMELSEAPIGSAKLQTMQRQLGSLATPFLRDLIPPVFAGMQARELLLRIMADHAKDVELLMRGLSGNVTTDMDLHVGDLADIARRSPELVALFDSPDPVAAFDSIHEVEEGAAFLAAWEQFLERYGMRGPSEIDISRPRWREEPDSLLQVIAGNLQHGESGSHRQQHQRMMADGEAAAERLVDAAKRGLWGPLRSRIVHRLVRVVRNLLAVREHPKLLLVRVLDQIRDTVLESGRQLQAQGHIDTIDDIWYLELDEVITAMETPSDDLRRQIAQRRADMVRFQKMDPPRVITSDGEVPIVKRSREDLPAGALPGSPVSSGTVEGVARVVIDPTSETLIPGEILVTRFTDPGWTPLFINAAGLVMEVGGLMTHGSVVAREYGIPAVVGVLDATQEIQTGQRIRVHGDLGYVEILNPESNSEGQTT